MKGLRWGSQNSRSPRRSYLAETDLMSKTNILQKVCCCSLFEERYRAGQGEEELSSPLLVLCDRKPALQNGGLKRKNCRFRSFSYVVF